MSRSNQSSCLRSSHLPIDFAGGCWNYQVAFCCWSLSREPTFFLNSGLGCNETRSCTSWQRLTASSSCCLWCCRWNFHPRRILLSHRCRPCRSNCLGLMSFGAGDRATGACCFGRSPWRRQMVCCLFFVGCSGPRGCLHAIANSLFLDCCESWGLIKIFDRKSSYWNWGRGYLVSHYDWLHQIPHPRQSNHPKIQNPNQNYWPTWTPHFLLSSRPNFDFAYATSSQSYRPHLA